MKYCSNCGAQLIFESKFCSGCGSQIAEIATQQTAIKPLNLEIKSESTNNRILMPDGTVYEGELKDGIANGIGKFTYQKNIAYRIGWGIRGENRQIYNRFEGNLLNGEFEGLGKLFKDNQLVFEGCFKNGLKEGYGKEFDNELIIFEGQFKDGLYHGLGKEYYRYPNKTKYEGQFQYNDYNGIGTKYEEDEGEYWQGTFESHYLISGKKVVNNITVYEGEWEKELQQGRGVQYVPVFMDGYFERGEYIGTENPDEDEY